MCDERWMGVAWWSDDRWICGRISMVSITSRFRTSAEKYKRKMETEMCDLWWMGIVRWSNDHWICGRRSTVRITSGFHTLAKKYKRRMETAMCDVRWMGGSAMAIGSAEINGQDLFEKYEPQRWNKREIEWTWKWAKSNGRRALKEFLAIGHKTGLYEKWGLRA